MQNNFEPVNSPVQMPQIQSEEVNSPNHYNVGNIEVIDFIQDQKLNFSLGNVVKYVCRSNHKGNKIKDLKKAIHYIEREIEDTLRNEELARYRANQKVEEQVINAKN